jgi:hypothetical protein
MPSFVTMALAPLAVLAAYVIFGISGFGSTLIAITRRAQLACC